MQIPIGAIAAPLPKYPQSHTVPVTLFDEDIIPADKTKWHNATNFDPPTVSKPLQRFSGIGPVLADYLHESANLQQGVFMGSEKENTMRNDDRSNSSTKHGGQQSQNADRMPHDPKADKTKQGSGMNPSRFDKPDQRRTDDKKDVDAERHPEEQVTKPKEYKKDDQKYNDKSERA